ncbi:MAG: S4 domain-containing protein [Caulobacterales bacterium]|uniref:S4 domain-containing protein n=1 Tax=Glycocaulis sp. TaxID=1969725 RepID=UPI003FA0AD21
MDAAMEPVRIDVWLFRARFAKSRAIASDLLAKGHLRLERHGQVMRVTKASARLQPGDILTLPLKSGPLRVEVCAMGVRRGPPEEARTLYRIADNADP